MERLILPGGAAMVAGRATDGTDTTVEQVRASLESEVIAAHRMIYDNHNPLRCRDVLAAIKRNEALNTADLLAVAAMLLGSVMAPMPEATQYEVLGAVIRMARMTAVSGEAQPFEGDATAGAGPG